MDLTEFFTDDEFLSFLDFRSAEKIFHNLIINFNIREKIGHSTLGYGLMDIIYNNPDLPFTPAIISSYTDLPLEYIEEHYDEGFYLSEFARNKNLTPEFVYKHKVSYSKSGRPHEWDYHDFLFLPFDNGYGIPWVNPNFTAKFLEDNDHKYKNDKSVSASPLITMDFVESHPDWNWKYESNYIDYKHSELKGLGLSFNPNLTFEFFNKHQNEKWTYGKFGLSANPLITMDYVEAHPDKNWFYGDDGLSSNPNLTFDFILKTLHLFPQLYLQEGETPAKEFYEYKLREKNCWHFSNINILSKLPLEFITENWNKIKINFAILAGCPQITVEFIDSHPEYPWDLEYIDGLWARPDLTEEFIDKYFIYNDEMDKTDEDILTIFQIILVNNETISSEYIRKHKDLFFHFQNW